MATGQKRGNAEFLTAAGVAEYLGMGESWVWKAKRRHGLPFVKMGGGIRFRRSAVDLWVKRREESISENQRQ